MPIPPESIPDGPMDTPCAPAQAKTALRARIRSGRARRTEQDRAMTARAFADRVMALPAVAQARAVALTIAGRTEPPTDAIIAALAARGVTVLAPQVRPDGGMDWLPIDASTSWQANQFGIQEPVGAGGALDADVVLVPALAVAPDGRRLGQGGGYFDRALVSAERSITTIAVVFDDEILDDVPCEPHDARVDWVVTERRVLDCRGA